MLVYCLPVLFGYLADKYTGRWNMICWGVGVCGVAHIIMISSGAPTLLQDGHAAAPFMISLYILAIGAGTCCIPCKFLVSYTNYKIAMFKPNVSPTLLDQMPDKQAIVKTLENGEKVIVDPEATTERVVLWFYLLINIGGFLGVPATYTEKYSGWLLTFVIPLICYLPLPLVLWWLKKRLVLYPPGGSDLLNCFRVLGICLKKGIFKIGCHGFWEAAKPSVIAAGGGSEKVPWNDHFVEDVRRTFQATGMFCFFPIQYINDNGLGIATDALSTMFITNGVPNDLLYNFNSLSIIVLAPVLNYGLYPLLRKWHVRYGPVARITTGLLLSSVGAVGYTLLNYYAYKLGPCGKHGSSATCIDAEGHSLVAPISIWWLALPFSIGGISELFINVPAYGIAYSRAPKNMRGLVSALNLFNTGIAYALGLAFSGLVRDPYLTWVFGAPTIIGFIAAAVFYYLFRHIDNEEYVLSTNDSYGNDDHEGSLEGSEIFEKTDVHAKGHDIPVGKDEEAVPVRN
jgi:dipeptide/tripeptide permease